MKTRFEIKIDDYKIAQLYRVRETKDWKGRPGDKRIAQHCWRQECDCDERCPMFQLGTATINGFESTVLTLNCMEPARQIPVTIVEEEA